jgi:hypothetical protein
MRATDGQRHETGIFRESEKRIGRQGFLLLNGRKAKPMRNFLTARKGDL